MALYQCKKCKKFKEVEDFLKFNHSDDQICKKCNHKKNLKKYQQNHKEQWRENYNKYRSEHYLKDEKAYFRQRMSQYFSKEKKKEYSGVKSYIEFNDTCGLCNHKIRVNQEKNLYIRDEIFKTDIDFKKPLKWEDVKNFTILAHKKCILDNRKKWQENPIYRVKKMKLLSGEFSNTIENYPNINSTILTYLFYVGNRMVKNDRLSGYLLSLDDPMLYRLVTRKKYRVKYNYGDTSKFGKKLLLSHFGITSENIWERKNEVISAIFEYFYSKTQDSVWVNDILISFRLSLEVLCLPYHMRAYEKTS